MPILGTIIKKLIETKDKVSDFLERDPVEDQNKVLKELLAQAKDTAFGRHYHFDEILESENPAERFAQTVPFFDYNKINDEWWYRLHDGESDVTWPGSPSYFALSSGTTGGTSKRIPITDEMIQSIRRAGIRQVEALANFDLDPEFFEKEIMMLGSSTDLIDKGSHQEGEISGISASNIPFWFRSYYKPGMEISKIDDWDTRVQKIVEQAGDWDIGALSGIPSWMELMLQKVIEYHDLETIHDIWPNLQVYTSGGVAFEPYEKSFNKLLAHPIIVIDTYLASEGFIALQSRKETQSMKLLTNNGLYFEFVPFESQYIQSDGSLVPDAPSIGLSDVEQGKDYVLLLSSVSGLWRYMIGDTIQFTDVDRYEIRITGRTKFFLNVVGSQLSVNKMNDAIRHLEDKYDLKIPEFTVAAVKIDGSYYHHWYLGTDTPEFPVDELTDTLDEYLQSHNKNYGVARSKALHGVRVNLVPKARFYDWSERNKKKGGQVKMEKVMDEEKFQEWEAFCESQ
ncbi:GH3 auxin-responsive promoter family protein [Membranicola marinus]|uniref:GH3 auxin-responsive promoter family protein n=1 Tax=Membranihabitans marinus TaxID=1227546 RepID=A0A953LAT1_9BACT|nr:GH3 auxin-responsive promoter family protein [Membranihabitans marinus]MBY5957896.1 GH3 auxin-responsive promoter family protein [Membranihabitans marinus]